MNDPSIFIVTAPQQTHVFPTLRSRKRSIVQGTSRIVRFLVFTLVLIAAPVLMVKREDFKTCAQQGFCTRQRAYADLVEFLSNENTNASQAFPAEHVQSKPSLAGYALANVRVNKTACQIRGDLVWEPYENAPPDVPVPSTTLKLVIDSLQKGTVRIRVEEHLPPSSPLRPRYDGVAGFVLDGPPKVAPLHSFVANSKVVVASFESGDLTITLGRDWSLQFSVQNAPAVVINAESYFHYEAVRAKSDPAIALVPPISSPNDPLTPYERLVANLNASLWEESFKSWTDSKPHGPTSVGLDVSFPGSRHLYGLPEHASSFSLKPTRAENISYSDPYRLYNFDVFEYELDNPMALYGSIPFILSHTMSLSTGVFWLNAAELYVDYQQTSGAALTHWMVESGMLDLFVFLGPTPQAVVDAFTSIVGRPTLPQAFAIAYHQCRWNYNDHADVLEVDENFDKHDIPYDTLWLDIEHTDGKKYFTWDYRKFPSPMEMQATLSSHGRKMVTIVDPHIKKDSGYRVFNDAKSLDIFTKSSSSADYEGHCWPGTSIWIDYTNPKGNAYWADQFKYSVYKDSTPSLYTWNDMNEPSVFTGPEITMPKDNIHFGGVEHRDIHNIYGFLQHRATFDGHMTRSDGRDRPFILTRAFFAGSQRYAAMWTGDNIAKWDHLAASVPMLLSVGIAGVVFGGADVGGFFGNPDAELLTRWYQLGAYQPFFRGHAHIDTARREPWVFGEPTTTRIRAALRSRYRILPYLYTLNWQATQTGAPIMRPMMWEFPTNEDTFGMDDQFMLGSALLVKPVTAAGATNVSVYLPDESIWFDWETLKIVIPDAGSGLALVSTPMEKIPVILRGGHIVSTRERMRRSSTLMMHDPFTLYVALNSESQAHGELYVDDGHSLEYQSGKYLVSNLDFSENRLTSKPKRLLPHDPPSKETVNALRSKVERIILLNLRKPLTRVTGVDGSLLHFSCAEIDRGHWKAVVKNPGVWMGELWSVEFSV